MFETVVRGGGVLITPLVHRPCVAPKPPNASLSGTREREQGCNSCRKHRPGHHQGRPWRPLPDESVRDRRRDRTR